MGARSVHYRPPLAPQTCSVHPGSRLRIWSVPAGEIHTDGAGIVMAPGAIAGAHHPLPHHPPQMAGLLGQPVATAASPCPAVGLSIYSEVWSCCRRQGPPVVAR